MEIIQAFLNEVHGIILQILLGQYSIETYFAIGACFLMLIVVLPVALRMNKKSVDDLNEFTKSVKNTFGNYDNREYVLDVQYPSLAKGIARHEMDRGAISSSRIKTIVRNAHSISFSVYYYYKANRFESKNSINKFREELLQIDGKDNLEMIISVNEIVKYIESIDYNCSPAFKLSLQNDELILHIDKTSRDLEFWREHVEFLKKLADKIEHL